MLPGVDFLTGRRILIFGLAFSFLFSFAPAQSQAASQKEGIYVIVKDAGGEKVEGNLRLGPDELTVQSKDQQEKKILLKYIQSIRVERSKDLIPGGDSNREPTYDVHLQNSQEIYTLHKKYTFSLNTKLGFVTRTIDPEQLNRLFAKDQPPSTKPGEEKPFIQDESIVLSLEFKF
jgi:hypothetical protein